MDKIIVLKNTKYGVVVDTIYNSSDTLKAKQNTVTLQLPKEQLAVKTYSDPPQGLDLFSFWITTLGGVAGLIAVVVSFYQLFKKDGDKQRQIDELAKQTAALIRQNQLFEKRIKILVKPRIWTNTSSHNNHDQTFYIGIDNRGELAFIDDFEIIEGDVVTLNKFGGPVTLLKDATILITGSTSGALMPSKMNFKLKMKYRDQENYKYETTFIWTGGFAKIGETIEND